MSKSLECSHATGTPDESCDLVKGLEKALRKAYDDMGAMRVDDELCRLRRYVGHVEDANAALEQGCKAAEAQIATAMSLLKPACAEESLEGAIRNLQQAHQSERYNAETLEKELRVLRVFTGVIEGMVKVRVPELVRCLSHEKCSACGQAYSVDPNTGIGCKLADHIEAYNAISGKAG